MGVIASPSSFPPFARTPFSSSLLPLAFPFSLTTYYPSFSLFLICFLFPFPTSLTISSPSFLYSCSVSFFLFPFPFLSPFPLPPFYIPLLSLFTFSPLPSLFSLPLLYFIFPRPFYIFFYLLLSPSPFLSALTIYLSLSASSLLSALLQISFLLIFISPVFQTYPLVSVIFIEFYFPWDYDVFCVFSSFLDISPVI